jgi:hypothetical protein
MKKIKRVLWNGDVEPSAEAGLASCLIDDQRLVAMAGGTTPVRNDQP